MRFIQHAVHDSASSNFLIGELRLRLMKREHTGHFRKIISLSLSFTFKAEFQTAKPRLIVVYGFLLKFLTLCSVAEFALNTSNGFCGDESILWMKR